MEENKSTLMNRIRWTEKAKDISELDEEKSILLRCQQLENEGFGMLASQLDASIIDQTNSIVFPDGEILSPLQIMAYWEKRNGSYSSKNPEDVKMHKARVYYLSFKREI